MMERKAMPAFHRNNKVSNQAALAANIFRELPIY